MAGPVGLPVHDQEAAVGLVVHRVDPAAHHLAVEHQRERRLDRVRDAVAERALLELRDELVEVGLVVDAEVGAAGQVVGVEQRLLLEAVLDPRVEQGAEPRRPARRPRHRPGQLPGELVRVLVQPQE